MKIFIYILQYLRDQQLNSICIQLSFSLLYISFLSCILYFQNIYIYIVHFRWAESKMASQVVQIHSECHGKRQFQNT